MKVTSPKVSKMKVSGFIVCTTLRMIKSGYVSNFTSTTYLFVMSYGFSVHMMKEKIDRYE